LNLWRRGSRSRSSLLGGTGRPPSRTGEFTIHFFIRSSPSGVMDVLPSASLRRCMYRFRSSSPTSSAAIVKSSSPSVSAPCACMRAAHRVVISFVSVLERQPNLTIVLIDLIKQLQQSPLLIGEIHKPLSTERSPRCHEWSIRSLGCNLHAKHSCCL